MGCFRILGVLLTNEFYESKGLTEGKFVPSCQLADLLRWRNSIFIELCIWKQQNKVFVLFIIFFFFQSTFNALDWSLKKAAGLVIMGTDCLVFKVATLSKFIKLVTGN